MAENIYLNLWNKRMQLKKVTLLDEDVIYGINDYLEGHESDPDKWKGRSVNPFHGEEDSLIWPDNLWRSLKENRHKSRKKGSASLSCEEQDRSIENSGIPFLDRRRRMDQWKSKLDEVAARRKKQREKEVCMSVKPQKSINEIWRNQITNEKTLSSMWSLTDSNEVTNVEPDPPLRKLLYMAWRKGLDTGTLSWPQIQKLLLNRPDYSDYLYWPSKETPIKGLLDEYEEPLWWHDEKTRMEESVYQHRILLYDDEDYLMPAGGEENGVRFILASELRRARRRLPRSRTEIALRPSRKRTRFPATSPPRPSRTGSVVDKSCAVLCVVQRDRHTSTSTLLLPTSTTV